MKKDIYFILFVVVIGTVSIYLSGKRGQDTVLVKKKESYQSAEDVSASFGSVNLQSYSNKTRNYSLPSTSESLDERSTVNLEGVGAERYGKYDRPLSESLGYDDYSETAQNPDIYKEQSSEQSSDDLDARDDWELAFFAWKSALVNSVENGHELAVLSGADSCSFYLNAGRAKPLDVLDVSKLTVSTNGRELTFSYSDTSITLLISSRASAIYTKTLSLISMC